MKHLKKFDDYQEINERFGDKIKPFIEKYRKEIKAFGDKFKQEVKESKEMTQILRKGRKSMTPEESKFVKKQMIDTAKALGLGAVFMVPFVGLASTALLIYLDKTFNWGILPSAFSGDNNEEKEEMEEKED